MELELRCTKCGAKYPIDEMVYRCVSCDYPLEVNYDYEVLKAQAST